ncbi:MAG: heavy-metal-associated domain-containing protein [Tissierellia bacterium]|nr:heavy-metal-associated domain-containing protein [Tissierellia bacterium]
MMEKIIMVEGMTCGHCEKAVKEALGELEGVNNVEVDLTTGKVVVKGEELEDSKLREAIDEAGYEVASIS